MNRMVFTMVFSLNLFVSSFAQCLILNGEELNLNSQLDVDSFHIDHPDCDSILGSLTISGGADGPNNLDGLLGIKYIAEDLMLNGADKILSLGGLDSLKEVNGSLSIWFSPRLNNLEGLGNLEKITGDFTISENSSNDSLGLAGMENLKGIYSLDSIKGSLILHWNQLDSYLGLDSLKYIGGLIVGNNNNTGQIPYDTILNGLQNLGDYLHGGLSLRGSQVEITSFDSLDVLYDIAGDLILSNLPSDDFTRFDSIRSLEGRFMFSNNFNATSLPSFLKNIDHIDSLSIGGNPFITDLNELSDINTISGELVIANNKRLNDISALDEVNLDSVVRLLIVDNPNLFACESLCPYLNDGDHLSLVFDNADGCKSIEEVLITCGVSSLNDQNSNIEQVFYPNPSLGSGKINFAKKVEYLSLYSSDLNTIINKHRVNSTYFKLPNLPKGIYFIALDNNKLKPLVIE